MSLIALTVAASTAVNAAAATGAAVAVTVVSFAVGVVVGFVVTAVAIVVVLAASAATGAAAAVTVVDDATPEAVSKGALVTARPGVDTPGSEPLDRPPQAVRLNSAITVPPIRRVRATERSGVVAMVVLLTSGLQICDDGLGVGEGGFEVLMRRAD